MRISIKNSWCQPLLVGAVAAALSGTSVADEPPAVKDQQVVVIVKTENDENESQAKSEKEETSAAPKLWLGIGLKEVTGDLAEYLGNDKGVMVFATKYNHCVLSLTSRKRKPAPNSQAFEPVSTVHY